MNNVSTLEEALSIISEQDRIIGEQYRKILDLEDSSRKRNQWLHSAKRAAGYDSNISFDDVWKDVLEKSFKYDELSK